MFCINLHDNEEYISKFILKNGYWDKNKTLIIEKIIENNKNIVFVDIGANIGYFSLFCASKGIKTISFEPIKDNYELFIKSIKDNGFEDLIKLYEVALGNVRKMGVFNVMRYNMGCCTTIDFLNNRKPDYTVNSDILLGDDFLVNVDKDMIVKIDVENMEKEVIEGLKETLTKGRILYIFIEISKTYNKMSLEIFDILKSNGFTKGLLIDVIDDENQIDFKSISFLRELSTIEELREIHLNSNNNTQMECLFIYT